MLLFNKCWSICL